MRQKFGKSMFNALYKIDERNSFINFINNKSQSLEKKLIFINMCCFDDCIKLLSEHFNARIFRYDLLNKADCKKISLELLSVDFVQKNKIFVCIHIETVNMTKILEIIENYKNYSKDYLLVFLVTSSKFVTQSCNFNKAETILIEYSFFENQTTLVNNNNIDLVKKVFKLYTYGMNSTEILLIIANDVIELDSILDVFQAVNKISSYILDDQFLISFLKKSINLYLSAKLL